MLIGIAATLAVAYIAIGALVFAFQRKLVFPAPTQKAPLSDGWETARLPGGSFYLWSNAGNGPVVVHFHGNAEQVADSLFLARAWKERGVSFAAVEYPGYPGAAGSPSESSLVAAGEEALRHLTEVRGVSPDRIVLSGQSVGTGVAVALASKGHGRRLILLSPYTSLPDVAATLFRWLPVRLLMRDRFDSLAKAPTVRVPTLVVHGTDDEVIPFALGKRLAEGLADARLVAIEGAGHNDLWTHAQTGAVFEFVVR